MDTELYPEMCKVIKGTNPLTIMIKRIANQKRKRKFMEYKIDLVEGCFFPFSDLSKEGIEQILNIQEIMKKMGEVQGQCLTEKARRRMKDAEVKISGITIPCYSDSEFVCSRLYNPEDDRKKDIFRIIIETVKGLVEEETEKIKSRLLLSQIFQTENRTENRKDSILKIEEIGEEKLKKIVSGISTNTVGINFVISLETPILPFITAEYHYDFYDPEYGTALERILKALQEIDIKDKLHMLLVNMKIAQKLDFPIYLEENSLLLVIPGDKKNQIKESILAEGFTTEFTKRFVGELLIDYL